MDERALRVAEAVRAAGADWAVLTAPASVSYATGHDEPAGAGRSPFAGGPAVAIVAADGHTVLVAADADIDPGAVRTDATQSYEAFALPPGGPGLDGLYLDTVRAALAESGVGGTVGVEPATCPDGVRGLLAGTTVDLTAALRDARVGQDARGGGGPARVRGADRGRTARRARRRRAGDDRARAVRRDPPRA